MHLTDLNTVVEVEMETLWGYRGYSAAALPSDTGVQHWVTLLLKCIFRFIYLFSTISEFKLWTVSFLRI